MTNKTPTYNLKVVIQETGIKPDTLRAWERRYGLPQPKRTTGGHRLYSAYDIEILKWLHARQEEGLSISRAVELWKSIESEGKDPLRAMRYETGPSPQVSISGESLDELCRAWMESVLVYDEMAAEQALAMAFARYPTETVVIEVLQKGLSAMGDAWYSGKVSVQQEHFASVLVMRRLDAILAAAPQPTRSAKVVIANPPGEEHVFSGLFLALLLRQRGWSVVYLGSNVPLVQLDSTINTVEPDLIVLTAMQLRTAAALLELCENLQQYDVPVAYGGLIFTQSPGLCKYIPGYYLGDQIYQGVDNVEKILMGVIESHEPVPPNVIKRALAAEYQDNLAAIETEVRQVLRHEKVIMDYLETANFHFQWDIYAALFLGDINLLAPQIEWLNTLLKNNHFQTKAMGKYFKAYAQAIQHVLGREAAELTDWLLKNAV